MNEDEFGDDDAVSLPGPVPERRRQRQQDVGRRVRVGGVRVVEAAEAGCADPENQGWGISLAGQINNLKMSV